MATKTDVTADTKTADPKFQVPEPAASAPEASEPDANEPDQPGVTGRAVPPDDDVHDEGTYGEPLSGMATTGSASLMGLYAQSTRDADEIPCREQYDHQKHLERANVAVAYLGTEYTSSGQDRMKVISAAEAVLLEFFKPDYPAKKA